jgi:hypothetical protein
LCFLLQVAVDVILILELGMDFTVIRQENVTGDFSDGDVFNYTSIVATDSGGEIQVPRVIQLNLFGFNALQEPLLNNYAIAFTNNCNAYPALYEGGSAGWTRFVSFFGCWPKRYPHWSNHFALFRVPFHPDSI